jgi:hypothetical protein
MDIPKGKHYEGTFSEVSGAAAKMWHLTINSYHRGQLHLLERGWVFFSNSGDFEELAGYFGDIVMLWYE